MSHPLVVLGWLFRSIFTALVLAMLGFGVALAAGWLPVGQMPTLFHKDGVRRINCTYAFEAEATFFPMTLEFMDQGYTAVLRHGQTQTKLQFAPGNLFSEVWKGDNIELTLGPEIYISGLGGRRIGPCDSGSSP
jgi:hypothetical protein